VTSTTNTGNELSATEAARRIASGALTSEALVEASHATVRARFQNGGLNEEVVYDLVWEDDRWKVDNIRAEGWDLRAIATGA